jgi:hypothetical protein
MFKYANCANMKSFRGLRKQNMPQKYCNLNTIQWQEIVKVAGVVLFTSIKYATPISPTPYNNHQWIGRSWRKKGMCFLPCDWFIFSNIILIFFFLSSISIACYKFLGLFADFVMLGDCFSVQDVSQLAIFVISIVNFNLWFIIKFAMGNIIYEIYLALACPPNLYHSFYPLIKIWLIFHLFHLHAPGQIVMW